MNLGDSAAYGAPSLSRRRFYGMDPFKAQRLNKSLKFFLTWKLPFLMPRGMVLNFKKSISCVRHELLGDPGARTETSKIDFFAVNYPPITTVSTSARLGTMDAARRYLETSEILTLNHPNGCGSTPWIAINSCYSYHLLWVFAWTSSYLGMGHGTLVPFVNPKS